MISYNESLEILKKISLQYPSQQYEDVSLPQSVGRILEAHVIATENNPSFDHSAMDGFALNISSLKQRRITTDDWIPVQNLVCAGDEDTHIQEDCLAIEIMTGAPIPSDYFDTVVRVENVEQKVDASGNKIIRLNCQPMIGQNIRRVGEDIKPGDVLLKKGTRISNEHLLPLAAQGVSQLRVKKQIKIALLSTGKELVPYDTKELRQGQIRNSTGLYLEAALSEPIFKLKNYGIIQDDPDSYIQNLKTIFDDNCDIVISTGAVSMGVHDFVKSAIINMGAKIHFHKCAIRPGKPILFASLTYSDRTLFIFGLPGNPVSTAVGFKFFVKPFLSLLLNGYFESPKKAILISDTKKPEGLRCFFKAKVTVDDSGLNVESLKGQASFMLAPFVESNAWVVFPETGSDIKKGTTVEVFHL